MRKIFITLAIIIILMCCAKIMQTKENIDQAEKITVMELTKFTHIIDTQTISGVTAGKKCNPALLFVHGAPGSWTSWNSYLTDKDLLDKFFMIAIDRPGYGASGYGTPITNIKNQASFITKAITKEHKGPYTTVGHSFGGPVQLQIAIDFSERTTAQLILAGAIAPKIHYKRFYHKLGDLFFIRSLLPAALKVTNSEMMMLQENLQNQSAHLSSIKIPTTIIQGNNDWLVPKGNAAFAKNQLTAVKNIEIIELKKQGHFLPWEQYDLVKKQILSFATNSQCET